MSEVINLSIPFLNGNEWKYVKECLDTGWVSSVGKYVEKFEVDICKYLNAKYATACINGTSGIYISLYMAGVKMGDEVLVPTLTFIAPINAVKYLYAEPVFMDCDDYMNIDAEKLNSFCKNECKITKKGLNNKKSGRIIKAILPVHVFGNPCDMESIMKIAVKYNLKVIEDATESLGTYFTKGRYRNKFTGTIGDSGVFSFNGNKIITAGGGGMIIANNKEDSQRAKYLTTQAKDDNIRFIHHEIGYNFRLTNVQAALAVAQLEQLNNFIKVKKRNYQSYKKGLANIKGISLLGIPKNSSPNYWMYSLIIDKKKYGLDREGLTKILKLANIETRPVWYLNHLQKPYINNQSYKIEKALWFWERVLNIPSSVNLTPQNIDKVVGVIKNNVRCN